MQYDAPTHGRIRSASPASSFWTMCGSAMCARVIPTMSTRPSSIATDDAISHVIPGLGTPLAPANWSAGASGVPRPGITCEIASSVAIAEGLVDMVGMTRAHMADPHIVQKLEAGEADRIRPCVGASYCINRLYLGLEALCIHNPAMGREETIAHVSTRSRGPRRRVVVVGAGPGGLEAARVAAERGHEVTLLEAAPELGGQVRLAARATPRRGDLVGIVDWLAAECRLLGVDIRRNTVAEV